MNDGAVLHGTLAGVLDRFPELVTVAVVPLGVSRYSKEPTMRAHTRREARATVETVQEWQERFARALGRRVVWASDEYYLLAGVALPEAGRIRGLPAARERCRDGARVRAVLRGASVCEPGDRGGVPARTGFFAWVEGAPAEGYRAPRTSSVSLIARPAPADRGAPVTILTGGYGSLVLRPLLDRHGFDKVRVLAVPNEFFGGNIAVAGLLTGSDLARSSLAEPEGGRYLLPDVCLSKGRFIDGSSLEDLPCPVEVVAADGASLRRALEVGR